MKKSKVVAGDNELIEKAESVLDKHEIEQTPNEESNPENKLTDSEVLKKLQDIMSLPGMTHLCGMVVINWRIYAVIRQEIENIAKGKMDAEVFSALLQGLNSTAMEPFSITDLKQDVKNKLLTWIRRVSDDRVNQNRRRKHGDAKTTEDDT